METNFFSEVANLKIAGDLLFTIRTLNDSRILVSVMVSNQNCKDNASAIIPPLTFTGTPQELNDQFFQTITSPLQTTAGILSSMDAYKTAQEQAVKQSAEQKAAQAKLEKEKSEKEKKYNASMKAVKEHEDAGLFAEAMAKLPDVKDYPDKAPALKIKREQLQAKCAPSLFSSNH